MKIAKTSSGVKDTWQKSVNEIDTDLSKVFETLKGRVRFGGGSDGARGENMHGEFQLFTSHGTADTEFTVAHTLGSTPIGRLVLYQDKAGSLYQAPATGTAWTSANVYFKCDVASVTFLVFLLK